MIWGGEQPQYFEENSPIPNKTSSIANYNDSVAFEEEMPAMEQTLGMDGAVGMNGMEQTPGMDGAVGMNGMEQTPGMDGMLNDGNIFSSSMENNTINEEGWENYEFEFNYENNISEQELNLVEEYNLDLTETFVDENNNVCPRYVIAMGFSDRQYHIYDRQASKVAKDNENNDEFYTNDNTYGNTNNSYGLAVARIYGANHSRENKGGKDINRSDGCLMTSEKYAENGFSNLVGSVEGNIYAINGDNSMVYMYTEYATSDINLNDSDDLAYLANGLKALLSV